MSKNAKIRKAQKWIQEMGADGWLIYDFHKNNYLAHIFLEIPCQSKITRRFFYWIPKEGEPVRIVHAIESHVLDGWPGEKRIFLSWQSLRKEVGAVLQGIKTIAMEYSAMNANPYISCVDAGTVDLVRSFGIDVVSSGPFLPYFTAVLSQKQGESHIRASQTLERIVKETWLWVSSQMQSDMTVSEYHIQKWILKEFEKAALITDSLPIVAINAHSADPHFETKKDGASVLKKGDFLLIDLWAKEKEEGAVFGDITRVAIADHRPTERQTQIFQIVRAAQKAGIDLVKCRFAEKKEVRGFEIDDAVRQVICEKGFGKFFTHRTGHSIEVHLHGSGPHIDNLEMHEDRPILPGTCFSIEPGIYLPGEFGVRLESDIYIHQNGQVEVTGGEQDEFFLLEKA